MADEQIMFRLGLDSTPFAQELNKTPGLISKVAGAAKEGFGKAEEAIHGMHRAWHKTLHAIGEESPLVSNALRIAFSPIAGTLLAGVAIFKSVHHALEELEKKFKAFGDAAAKPIGNFKKAVEEADEAMKKQAKDYQKWVDSHKDAGKEISDGLEFQLSILKQQQTILDNILEREKQRALQSVRDAVRTGSMTKERGEIEEKKIEAAAAGFKGVNDFRVLGQEIALRQQAAGALGTQRDASGRALDQLSASQKRAGFIQTAMRPHEIAELEKFKAAMEKQLEEALGAGHSILGFHFRGLDEVIGGKEFGPERIRQMISSTEAALERAKGKQKGDAERSAEIAERVEKGRSNFDSLNSQIRAEQQAILRARMHQGELLSTMDPNTQRAAVNRTAYQQFISDRQKLFLRYGERFDPRTGKVVDGSGRELQYQGAQGREFSGNLQTLTHDYLTGTNRDRANLIKQQTDATKSLNEIHALLQKVMDTP